MTPAGTVRVADARDLAQEVPPGSVRLAYLDPPFFTGKRHASRAGAFDDAWRGDIDSYTAFLVEVAATWREALAPDGALLLHLDWHAVHEAKVACDRVFGRECFQDDLVWSYNSGGGSRHRYGRKHDTILWYGRGRRPYFDAEAARVPYDPKIAPSRVALFNDRGKVRGDVLEVPRPPNHSKEWVGWPTQKPLALLRLLVRIHSAPGDIVADPVCGSGTTLVAAAMEGRRYVGGDESPAAVALAERRLGHLSVNHSQCPERIEPQTPKG